MGSQWVAPARMGRFIPLGLLLTALALSTALPRNGRQDEVEVKETTPQTTTTTRKEEATDDKQLDATAVDDEESIEDEDEEDDNDNNEVDQSDNLDRCHKCAKPSFKFKKEFYCSKCVQQGVITVEEEKPVHCRKCRKV